MTTKWFHSPDIVGNWQTASENQNDNMVSLFNQTSFAVDPLQLSHNTMHSQFYPIGWAQMGATVVRLFTRPSESVGPPYYKTTMPPRPPVSDCLMIMQSDYPYRASGRM